MNAEVTPLRAPEPPAEQSRLNGVFDIPAPGRVAGWAIDRADPSVAVDVQIFREGALVATLRADRYRKDLERGGIGTGCYGFSMDLDPPLDPSMNFIIAVRAVTSDGLSGALRPTGVAQVSDDPATRLLEGTFLRVADLSRKLDHLAKTAEAPSNPVDPEALNATLERIELVQARLEQLQSRTEPRAAGSEGVELQVIAKLALLVGTMALALGLYSIFGR